MYWATRGAEDVALASGTRHASLCSQHCHAEEWKLQTILFYGRIVTVAHGPASREADGKDFAAIYVPTDETSSPTNAHKSLKLVEEKPRHISVRVFLG